MRRRTALRIAGFGAVGTLAGCIGNGDGDGDGDGVDIADTATLQLATRNSRPQWQARDGDRTGHLVVIDSEGRTEAVLNQYAREMPQDRTNRLGEFMERVDYDSDRLLLVESVGPNSCFDRIEVENIRVEDGLLRGDATTVATDESEGCEEAVTYPSVLVRVAFDNYPLDEAAVAVTDGWGDEATLTASTDDSLSPDPVDLPGHIRPEGEPEPVEPLVCDDEGFQRLVQGFDEDDIRLGDLERDGEVIYSMRVDSMEYSRGETVAISLTNVTDRETTTGNSSKFNLQVYTEDGWEDVRGADDDVPAHTDEGVVHYPGGGFEWAFELTESGLVAEGSRELRVCPDLQPGRYRFAFWGIGADAGALVVGFDLLE